MSSSSRNFRARNNPASCRSSSCAARNIGADERAAPGGFVPCAALSWQPTSARLTTNINTLRMGGPLQVVDGDRLLETAHGDRPFRREGKFRRVAEGVAHGLR